jgi:phage FluMu gp28-like protein
MKKVKKSPVLKEQRVVKKHPVKTPLLLIRKEPLDNIKDFNATMSESDKRARKQFLADKISNEVGYIQTLTETNLEKTVLYDYQQKFMLDRSRYRHVDKSRQIGQSYEFACEGYGKAQLMKIYTGMFVSFNQDEANEKIRYAKALDESTPHKYKKKMIIDRITALEWESKLPDGRTARTRLISHPQREPRGKGFNTDVFLDEIAHYQWPEKVYVASVPIITRGVGQLSLASTPLGQSGLHYEIGSNVIDYPEYSRHRIYWWNNPVFLNEDALKSFDEINELALSMETDARVHEFGNDAIRQAYNNMLEEYFQQEYELKAIDESVSFFSLDLIKRCTFEALMGEAVLEDGDTYGDHPVRLDPVYPGFNFETFITPEELSSAILRGTVSKNLIAGFDVGRKGDSSEIMVIEEVPRLNFLHVVRLMSTLKNTQYRLQFEYVQKLFSLLPIRLLRIDSTGSGDNLAEDLKKRFHSRIENVVFSNQNKGEMAVNLKIRMEDQILAIPNNRDLIRQIHSIKRKISENALIKYEIDNSEKRKHHGDKFWALALGSSAGEPAQMYRVKLFSSSLLPVKTTGRIVTAPIVRIAGRTPAYIGNYKNVPLPLKHFPEIGLPTHHELLH